MNGEEGVSAFEELFCDDDDNEDELLWPKFSAHIFRIGMETEQRLNGIALVGNRRINRTIDNGKDREQFVRVGK